MGERTKVTGLSEHVSYVWIGEVEKPKTRDYEVECPECGYGTEFGRLVENMRDCLRCNTPYLVEVRGPESSYVITDFAYGFDSSLQDMDFRHSEGRFGEYRLACPECEQRTELKPVVERDDTCQGCDAEIEIWLEGDEYRQERGWPDGDVDWGWPPSERSE